MSTQDVWGTSKNEARRKLGQTIHYYEEILALYNEQARNGFMV